MLETEFCKSPPYTVQRLAELVLHPKKHYRFLPAFLRALNRIVTVSSPVSDFPFPSRRAQSGGASLSPQVNGSPQINGSSEKDDLGSDASLGGALLTPIPWLKHHALGAPSAAGSTGAQREVELHSESTETIEGPNGAGSIETVSVTINGIPSATSIAHTIPPHPPSPTLSDQSDASSSSSSAGPPTTDAQLREQGAVTQGELLRQEQEAGVIPLTQATSIPSGRSLASGITSRDSSHASAPGVPLEDDEIPHARGPEEIGVEDIGPTHAAGDIEMRSRRRTASPSPPLDSEARQSADSRQPVHASDDMDEEGSDDVSR